MVNFNQVIVLEVEAAKDKHKDTEGGKYRRDSPWLVQAFINRGYTSKIVFITNKDTAESLTKQYPETAFLGRVNPMDYDDLKMSEYIKLLEDLQHAGVLLGPEPSGLNRLGSKMILYELRDTAMGTNDILLHKYEDMKNKSSEIDVILPPNGPSRVLKMMRGSTGLGVWKLENQDATPFLWPMLTRRTQNQYQEQKFFPNFFPSAKKMQSACLLCLSLKMENFAFFCLVMKSLTSFINVPSTLLPSQLLLALEPSTQR